MSNFALGENKWHFFRQLSLLNKCLVISVLLHALLLLVRFIAAQTFQPLWGNKLEIVLVNFLAQKALNKAKALAQVNSTGGGELDNGLTFSPYEAANLASNYLVVQELEFDSSRRH